MMNRYSKEYAEKQIKAAATILSNRQMTLEAFTYAKLYETMEELHFQGAYDLATDLALAVVNNEGTIA